MKKSIKYRSGFKYSLWETYTSQTNILGYTVKHRLFELTPEGVITIFEDYPWDGPSGPTFDTPSSMRGSLEHDALYEMIRLGLLPLDCFHKANEELRNICKEDGMLSFRADYWFKGVEEFGKSHINIQEEIILIAP